MVRWSNLESQVPEKEKRSRVIAKDIDSLEI